MNFENKEARIVVPTLLAIIEHQFHLSLEVGIASE